MEGGDISLRGKIVENCMLYVEGMTPAIHAYVNRCPILFWQHHN